MADDVFETVRAVAPLPDAASREAVRRRPPGKALYVGVGDGEFADWLADIGWHVTAVDASWTPLQELVGRSWGKGRDITAVHTDLQAYEAPVEAFDLVVVSSTDLAPEERMCLIRSAVSALRRGGLLILAADAYAGAADRSAR